MNAFFMGFFLSILASYIAEDGTEDGYWSRWFVVVVILHIVVFLIGFYD